jgi:hypothetical protein
MGGGVTSMSLVIGQTVRRAEPEFVNIQWRLKSRLFEESCLFKGQSVQQGLQWLQLFVLLLKTVLWKQFRKH